MTLRVNRDDRDELDVCYNSRDFSVAFFVVESKYLLSFVVVCYIFQGDFWIRADLRDKISNKRISCVEATVSIWGCRECIFC